MRQMNKTGRRIAAGAALLVAAPVVMSSVAYACQTLATLHATTPSVTAGSQVTLFGKNYAPSVSEGAQPSAISIRLDTKDGRVIGTFAPTANRTLSGNVTIPADVAAGQHTLLATQTTATGIPVSGTPGRATVQVTILTKTSTDGATASPVALVATDTAAATTGTVSAATPATPTAATPAAVAVAPVLASRAVTAGSVSASPSVDASAVAPTVAAPTVAAAAASASVAAATVAPSTETVAPASVTVDGLLSSASSSSSSGLLPGLTMAAGMALVLLSLGAFVKSGRSMLGGGATPLAG